MVCVVIVLGMKIRRYLSEELKCRIVAGISAFKQEKCDYMILSGGKTSVEYQLTEAQAMKEYAISKGIDENQIILEERAMSTLGNAFFSYKIIKNIKDVDKILVITSSYHIERSKFIFRKFFSPTYSISFDYYCEWAGNTDLENKKINDIKKFFEKLNKNEELSEEKITNEDIEIYERYR